MGGGGLCGSGKWVLWPTDRRSHLVVGPGAEAWSASSDCPGWRPVLRWAARATLSIKVTPARQCLQIPAARGGALEVSSPGQKPSWLLAAGRPDPGGGVILVTTVCLSR